MKIVKFMRLYRSRATHVDIIGELGDFIGGTVGHIHSYTNKRVISMSVECTKAD